MQAGADTQIFQRLAIVPLLTTSVEEHIFYHEFLLTSGRVYGGQEVDGQSMYCFNPHMSLCDSKKSTNDKPNKYGNASQY